MSAGELRVEFDAVAATATRLADASSGIREELAALDGRVAGLRAIWTGEAQEAYLRAQADWNGQMAELTTLLADAAAELSAAERRYQHAEHANASRWRP
ncbi:WXG100 family type VII secretion target [Leifsonia sp. Leaf264]|uniref:WXG100 family type VII secretion target n=1 Tax=Leifsonia sp. Leaf264 TaxID=1736314 RepID=UPI0006FF2F26|nr:WXG100 family type VII secretion target [Leifsonia sp. Leaf264]KQO95844.1 hypothetical protein ASF30_19870 [Leifsonia sp. Leaf264]